MPASQSADTWVLHRRPFRDTSLLIDLWTGEHGRLTVIGRGLRGRKRQVPVEPLKHYRVTWLPGRSDLGTLQSAEPLPGAPALHGEAAICALYCNELLMRLLTREDPHPDLFERYEQTLAELAEPSLPDAALRGFELTLLAELGVGFSLEQDAGGAPIKAGDAYVLVPERGLQRADDGFSGRAILAFAQGDLRDAGTRRDVRRLLRTALTPYLGSRSLQTAAMLRGLRKIEAGEPAGR